MSVNAQGVHATESKSGAGCLRGCLVTSAVLVAVAILGGIGLYFLGRTTIQRQLPVWEAQYPELRLAIDLLQLRGEFAEAGAELQGVGERQVGADDKRLLPDDIAVVLDPLVETYSLGEDQGVGFQRLAGSPETVIQELRSGMSAHGWELVSDTVVDGRQLLVWRKAARSCRMEVVAREEKTEVWLRYGPGGSGAVTPPES